jgi:hypothetical protein
MCCVLRAELEVLERDPRLGSLTRQSHIPVKGKPRSQMERQQRRIEGYIREMEAGIRTQKKRSETDTTDRQRDGAERGKKKQKHIPVRPKTPTVDGGDDEDKFEGALLLQRLLIGRAAQRMMLDGKEKRADLIRELRLEEQLAQQLEQMDLEDELNKEVQEKQVRPFLSSSLSLSLSLSFSSSFAPLSCSLSWRGRSWRAPSATLSDRQWTRSRRSSCASARSGAWRRWCSSPSGPVGCGRRRRAGGGRRRRRSARARTSACGR